MNVESLNTALNTDRNIAWQATHNNMGLAPYAFQSPLLLGQNGATDNLVYRNLSFMTLSLGRNHSERIEKIEEARKICQKLEIIQDEIQKNLEKFERTQKKIEDLCLFVIETTQPSLFFDSNAPTVASRGTKRGNDIQDDDHKSSDVSSSKEPPQKRQKPEKK